MIAELDALAEALAGQYAVEREIGRGGMGIVYLARDLKLDRLVAIKTLPPHLAGNSDVRERFLREARTAAHLSHPNIVPIHRADEIGGQVFFVMGYVDGDSLAQRIQATGRPPFAETVAQLRDVALALGYAHARGVVHRDVKAENILIDRATGRAVVTDFGIARLAESKQLTATGQVLGTVHYMSPEQVTGEAMDGRSDVYAVGVVAFLALSGRFPFDSETPSAILVSHVTRSAPRLLEVAPDVPPRLAAAVDRCLAKSPADRFDSCGALAEALAAAHDDATHADRVRSTNGRQLVSETQAQSVWRRAAELQAHTSSQPAPALPQLADRPARTLSESSSYQLSDVKASALDAGIPEAFVQQALAEHGLVRAPGDAQRGHVAPRPPGAQPAIVVKDGPPQKANPWVGTPSRILIDATIEGEMPERDYDLVLEIIRREIGEVGQIGSVGRTFTWSVSNQSRKLQISVMPRGGRTLVRIDEQLTNIMGGVFGGIMGGGAGGIGGAAMGSIAAQTDQPLLGLAAWIGVAAASYGAARLTFRKLAQNRREKLNELATEIATQIAETVSSPEPVDPKRRIGG